MKTVPRNCMNCNSDFLADPREINRGNAKFCTQKCSSAYTQSKRLALEMNTECAYCHVWFHMPQAKFDRSKSGLHFCSKQHQDLGFADPNVSVAPGPKGTGKRRLRKAYTCSYYRGCVATTDEYYCVKHLRIEEAIYQWMMGDSSVTIGNSQSQEPHSWVKPYIIHIRGDACEVCGFNELHPFYHTSIIQMDHVDGNSLNNDPSNLKLLCPNHHTMTITYGSRNKNSGRHSRRMASIRASMV